MTLDNGHISDVLKLALTEQMNSLLPKFKEDILRSIGNEVKGKVNTKYDKNISNVSLLPAIKVTGESALEKASSTNEFGAEILQTLTNNNDGIETRLALLETTLNIVSQNCSGLKQIKTSLSSNSTLLTEIMKVSLALCT